MPHGHGHCHHDHDHVNTDELGLQYSLYQKIDKDNVQCLNESEEGAGKKVFKPWEQHLDLTNISLIVEPESEIFYINYVESDADEELLFNIPFTGNIKLKGIKVSSADCDAHPSKLRLFKNKPNMTFDEANMEPDQVFELQKDIDGSLEYSPKIVKFSSISHLTMHFPSNFGAETTKIHYIGLRGEWSPAHRHGVTICTYESRPNLGDHKLEHLDSVSKQID